MQLPTVVNDLPMPVWITLIVLGFFLFWPLGVITLVYLIWSGKMLCCIGKLAPRTNEGEKSWNFLRGDIRSTGNVAFDEYRKATLERLEKERQEFASFLERLRRAKDQDEFDKFMAEQAAQRSSKEH